MVNSKVTLPTQQPVKFPKLLRCKHTGMVMLFTQPQFGVVINIGERDDGTYVGEVCSNPCRYDEDCWEILPVGATVTLEQL